MTEYNLNGLSITDLMFLEGKHKRLNNGKIVKMFRRRIAEKKQYDQAITRVMEMF